MIRVAVLCISLAYSINSIASDFEKKVPCLKVDDGKFIGWMTTQECTDKQGVSPDMLGNKNEKEILASDNLQNNQ